MTGSVLAPATQDRIDAAVARLTEAAARRSPADPVRDLIGATDVSLAYAVQERITAARVAAGAQIIGRKIGLTSEAIQSQVGVKEPDFGVLFDDMQRQDGSVAEFEGLLQPKAEVEIAFVLSRDLDLAKLDMEAVKNAVDYAVAAIEIVDSRVKGWDITITDTVADNASSGAFVLGSRKCRLDQFHPVDVTMTLTQNGTVVSSGTGRECLGDPLNALLWLAEKSQELGTPLLAGDVVLSGALGPMVDVRPGDVLVADIPALGSVSISFSQEG
jgi:2-keto-4-pentenoate hydratase